MMMLMRNEKILHRVTRDCLAEVFYPSYRTGESYILSSSVLPLLFQAVQKPTAIPLKMHGYMGILARVFSLKPVDIPGFHFWRKLEYYGKCD